MKILKEGQVHKSAPPPWWLNMASTCPKCGCEVSLELGDPIRVSTERHPGGKTTGNITCPMPGCHGNIPFERPPHATGPHL